MSEPGLELVYVRHPNLDDGAWVPKTALRQLGAQGWAEAEPPAPPQRGADGELLPPPPEPTAEPITDDTSDPTEDAPPKRKSRARGTDPEE